MGSYFYGTVYSYFYGTVYSKAWKRVELNNKEGDAREGVVTGGGARLRHFCHPSLMSTFPSDQELKRGGTGWPEQIASYLPR